MNRGRSTAVAFLLLLSLIGSFAPRPTVVEAAPERRAILYWGTRGSDVRWVQDRLRAWGYYRGGVDGVYGGRTAAAVRLFQRRNGLKVDGVVGPATWAALGRPLPQRAIARPAARARRTTRANDVELLARVVSAEARGEPYEGQVAVASVILNRVRDPRFPKTMQEVIYQPLAFESVANGEVYRTPTASSRRAARDALNGWDPTRGAVFFWNPAKPVSKWIWSRPIIKRVGNHVFAK